MSESPTGTIKTVQKTFGGEQMDVVLRKCRSIEESEGAFPPLQPETVVRDEVKEERDVAVELRDGTVIYADIYRPDGGAGVPAIVAWSPYGKRATHTPHGVPEGTLSPATKYEGPDPYYWCYQGYAVVNPDARGAGCSEGDIEVFGTTEGRDMADLIDWVGAREWCNGKVGMSGNSWLAIAQWFGAAERPAHLACIAPWEGCTDIYRQLVCHGGIPEVAFNSFLARRMVGPGWVEDTVENNHIHPLFDAYWEEKAAKLEQIEVPAYITAGWSHFHLWGSLEGFSRISSKDKWLRVHREFEWPDSYTPENLEELRRFFDRYLKGIRNGWELTPRVRLDVMDRGEADFVTRRAEKHFPLTDAKPQQLFLAPGDGSLAPDLPGSAEETTYEAVGGYATFDHVFDQGTEVTGYIKLRLWVEARGSNDLDLFVLLQKLDAAGNFVPTLVMGQEHPGAWAFMRASHRELDEERSTEFAPVHTHRREELLEEGEIVPVDTAIWPTSRYWHAGERLRLVIAGHYRRDPRWFEPFRWHHRNKGTHVVHAGGEYDSHLLLPVVPRVRDVVAEGPLTPLPTPPEPSFLQ
jgi:uncharacterized protein